LAIAGLADLKKVYKGYDSYDEAHRAWDRFTSTGRLPSDVAVSLGSNPYPIPPNVLAAPSILSSPRSVLSSPKHPNTIVYHRQSASPLASPSLDTNNSAARLAMPFRLSSPHTPSRAVNRLNTIQPIATPSALSSPTSIQNRTAATHVMVCEEAFRADQEDFSVVFTGTAPGVYKGRYVSIIMNL
jgi:hypothetical protein